MDQARIKSDERLYGIDIVRYFSFFAIVIYHLQYAVWGALGFDGVAVPSFTHSILEIYARALDFSGFTILFLSFFLFGYRPSRKWKFLWWILLGFFVIWSAVNGDFPYIWDIYPFLLVAVALIAVLRKMPPLTMTVLGAILVSIPFWRWEGRF